MVIKGTTSLRTVQHGKVECTYVQLSDTRVSLVGCDKRDRLQVCSGQCVLHSPERENWRRFLLGNPNRNETCDRAVGVCVHECVHAYVCVRVCVRERESERACVCVVCVLLCVCSLECVLVHKATASSS